MGCTLSMPTGPHLSLALARSMLTGGLCPEGHATSTMRQSACCPSRLPTSAISGETCLGCTCGSLISTTMNAP